MYCNQPTLTDEQRAVLEGRLTEAETAYHQLITGSAIASIRDQNGESATYTAANTGRLEGYINWLKMQLGLIRGVPPLRPFF